MSYNYKIKDSFNFQISLIISLIIIILFFYIFPDIKIPGELQKSNFEVKIYIEDIPITKQRTEAKKPPKNIKPEIAIPIPVEIEEIKEIDEENKEIVIADVEKEQLGNVSNETVEVSAKPILEVYPEFGSSNCNGVVKLLLLITSIGNVGEVRVLENTTVNSECAELAKQAAMKSKWLPAKIDNRNVNSWVTKIYKLNTNH